MQYSGITLHNASGTSESSVTPASVNVTPRTFSNRSRNRGMAMRRNLRVISQSISND